MRRPRGDHSGFARFDRSFHRHDHLKSLTKQPIVKAGDAMNPCRRYYPGPLCPPPFFDPCPCFHSRLSSSGLSAVGIARKNDMKQLVVLNLTNLRHQF